MLQGTSHDFNPERLRLARQWLMWICANMLHELLDKKMPHDWLQAEGQQARGLLRAPLLVARWGRRMQAMSSGYCLVTVDGRPGRALGVLMSPACERGTRRWTVGPRGRPTRPRSAT